MGLKGERGSQGQQGSPGNHGNPGYGGRDGNPGKFPWEGQAWFVYLMSGQGTDITREYQNFCGICLVVINESLLFCQRLLWF